MKRRTTSFLILVLGIIVAAVALLSCKGGSAKVAAVSERDQIRPFPKVAVPSVCTTVEEQVSYALAHFWDSFFSGNGLTDSLHILGVQKSELEQSLASFITLLDSKPVEEARGAVTNLFNGICKAQQADTARPVFTLMTQLVSRYLYDPNSPLRDEDYYLPFVKGLVASPLTPEDMRAAYKYELSGCEICQKGTVAPNFRIRNIHGQTFSLYSIQADFVMLFFSNPGCHACKGIIDEVQSQPKLQAMIASGSLAVVNVYIDEDLKAWWDYEHNYPETWKTGYDPDYQIRGERLYDVRAIPSLYLLDSAKRIILKDVPTEKVIGYLNRH